MRRKGWDCLVPLTNWPTLVTAASLSVVCAGAAMGCNPLGDGDDDNDTPNGDPGVGSAGPPPLDPTSPWPKFRANAIQNGRSPVAPVDTGADVWEYQTGKGIFSTPVIDGDDNVYVGSADHKFYALDAGGVPRWVVTTGEIIDSSAVLDDRERVYFGSGDGKLRALDRNDGSEVWTFEADDPAETGAFINWFEGNVAMRGDGALIAPNGNFRTYAIHRDDGTRLWHFTTRDQTWSLPAYNPNTNRLFMGNNFFVLQNTFAIHADDGTKAWGRMNAQGSVAASPLLTSTCRWGTMVVGSFDGFLRAYGQAWGLTRWSFGARDHLYASPGQGLDGAIIQPAADGTIYALDPDNGSLLWSYDTREPIRSSPAIDGEGNIYVGSGEGRLFVLNPNGTLRWSIQLIDEERNDLNSSPALGHGFVAIGGENGSVFGIPYDYCLRDGQTDPRCDLTPLPQNTVSLLQTTKFGGLLDAPRATLGANEPLTFSLLVRENDSTQLALIDSNSIQWSSSLGTPTVTVSGDRRFVTVVPDGAWTGPDGGTLTLTLRGDYLVDLSRYGLNFFGGRVGGSFSQTFEYAVQSPTGGDFPLPIADGEGSNTGVLELRRFAAPLPTILPSYNQIGFDSIHYLVGIVDRSPMDPNQMIGWGIGGTLDENGNTIIDPASPVRFPLALRHEQGELTLVNEQGFTIEFNGFPLPFDFFRISGTLGATPSSAFLNARAICGEIDFYGTFLSLLGLCNPDNDLLEVAGGAELGIHGVQSAPSGVGDTTFTQEDGTVSATLEGSALRVGEHNLGVLLVDETTWTAVPLNYATGTSSTANEQGEVQSVSVDLDGVVLPINVRAYLMVDDYPAAIGSVQSLVIEQ